VVNEIVVDEMAQYEQAAQRQATLLEKRAAAEAKIKAARIEYLESQIRTGEAALSRIVLRAVKQLEDWRAALRQLKPEPLEVAPELASVARSTHGEVERGHIDGQQAPALL